MPASKPRPVPDIAQVHKPALQKNQDFRLAYVGCLAITSHGSDLAREEMIRGPGTGHNHLAIFKLFSGGAVAVLLLFYRLRVNQVGDVEKHPVSVDLLAADLFLERIEELVYLDEESACLGLPLTLA